MEKLKELRNLLDQVRIEDFEGLNFEQSGKIWSIIYKKYKLLLSKWIRSCHEGEDISISDIERIIREKSNQIISKYKIRPNPKMPNPYDLLESFCKELNYLKFEVAKRDVDLETPLCYCSLRISNRIRPDFKYLVKYGRAILYYEDDEHIIEECRLCGTKWIEALPHGMLSSSNMWTVWDPDGDFLLREILKG